MFEPVPRSRAGLGWLLRRRFRSGQTHGAYLRASGGVLRSAALAAAKAGYCLVMTAASAFSAVAWRRNLLRAGLHVGVIAGLAGSRQAALYGGVADPAGQAPTAPSATLVN